MSGFIEHPDQDQLFDMERDPYEMDNLAVQAQYGPLLLEMKNGLADWMKQHGDPVWAGFCKINRLKKWALIIRGGTL